MTTAPATLGLERLTQIAVATAIVAVASGSTHVEEVRRYASGGRWVALCAVIVVASLLVYRRPRHAVPHPAPYIATLLFLALAIASAGWSVDPRLTLFRAVSVVLLMTAAGAVAAAAAGRLNVIRMILAAVVIAAGVVAAAGVALWIFDPAAGVQQATLGAPDRFRGFGENPNTSAMLLAVASPLALFFATDARTRRRDRVLSAIVLAVSVMSIFISGSRGAVAASFVAMMVLLALLRNVTRRPLVIVAIVLVYALGLFAMQASVALAANRAEARPAVAEHYPYDAWEVGRPRESGGSVPQRQLIGSSGRLTAWVGAVDQALQRPLLGYGFGAEERAFVDRYFVFEGGRPENSLLGLLLQLGLLGVVAFACVVGVFVRLVWRSISRTPPRVRAAACACASAGIAGILLAAGQSYIYAAGNIATFSVWTCGFLIASVAAKVPARHAPLPHARPAPLPHERVGAPSEPAHERVG